MKKIFRQSIYILFFLLQSLLANAQEFSKVLFYQVMENGTVEAVDRQLKIIEAGNNINKEAYAGTMLMKKAGLVKGPAKKLNIFKDGHTRLEAAIEKDKDNAEWHFLRLMIQENAPKILGYRSDIDKDAALIHSSFKKLTPEVQAAVLDYRKKSNALRKLNF